MTATDSRMISLAGHVGSGKSTVARIIAERTGREVFSTGRVFRGMAERLDMSVLELNEYARTHPEVDAEVDDHLRALAATPRHLVIDSRMAWFFVPQSFKVFLVVDAEVGGQRVHGAGRSDETYGSSAAARAEGKAREQVEAARYRDIYGVVRDDWRHYDLVVDTTHAPAEMVADIVLAALAEEERGGLGDRPICWLSPRRLLPTRMVEPGEAPFTGEGAPIDVVVADGHIVVADGHRRAAAALAAGLPVVRCRLVAFETESIDELPARAFAAMHTTAAEVDRWEAVHEVAFESYPAWLDRP